MAHSDSVTARSEWALRLARWVEIACRLEAFAPKAGNVHPGSRFADVCYEDFVRSGEVIAPVLATAREIGVGRAIRDSVLATQHAVGRNTNLGIILLLAPLAAVVEGETLHGGIGAVVERTTIDDAALVYEAIRMCAPGGLGRAAEEDVHNAPTVTLWEAMRLAASRDGVARQYTNGYQDVLEFGVPVFESALEQYGDVVTAILALQLQWMSRWPDTLIARKCGVDVAAESQVRAARVLDRGWPETAAGRQEFEEFDCWLRGDGNRRNPGTTADLIAAVLFAELRDGRHAATIEQTYGRIVAEEKRSQTGG